ncbi:HlyD family efflux transporter periplasmic adaptor subunit [Zunongwangia sp. F363]|uniref:HlyD family efflux transporter periplasmic adaptor subunit n=1 Tax=Autumnicola tepida TaxID=3075595 RepID=A0ABU3CE93_9FLAO|nr:HlyD family efflux transporter periplasmic adaptor subunit [Zunongwangia sp. F363]MDT0644621.1 HlyD family efflux transporter periplasmic adaptor subunit [Zunongwangia sp. F363]
MLNITNNKLHEKVNLLQYEAGKKVFNERNQKYFNRFLIAFGLILIIILFLPWTQTVAGKGYVTTLKPNQRPQTIQSPIPGRIEKWYVNEGDFVEEGDTILHISEVKNEYFDPQLVDRTGDQIKVKESSQNSYQNKIQFLTNQIGAIQQEKRLKIDQAKNKLQQSRLKFRSDSIDLEAAKTNLDIAERQFERAKTLNEEGLKSTTDLENSRLKLQEAQAKRVAQENKVLAARNEIINSQIELNRIEAEYGEKISKAQSDRSSAESALYQTQADISKLETSYANYDTRRGLYYIKAPQAGYINKAIKAGIGESFKEGEPLVGIMPSDYDIAVETFVAPIDMPLLHVGEEVRVQFDGWPAIVFSGWPNNSYGTYAAEIVAIENFISDNGKYRVLLAPKAEDHNWPEDIKIGAGASTLALLEDVPIWYEIWRQLNGFPPNYYSPENAEKTKVSKK